jgi:hypothetical protein
VLSGARSAFTSGLNTVAVVGAAILGLTALLAVFALRRR